MNFLPLLLAAAVIDVAGLLLIWFLLRARIRRFLELDKLLEGVRSEARSLVIELNETADRNVSLVEDRISALRELLDESDRRISVARREAGNRAVERDVYSQLAKRRPIVPVAEAPPPATASVPRAASATAVVPETPIRLPLGDTRPDERQISAPELHFSEDPIKVQRSRREEALDLYRKGFSAEIIAAKLDATVAEIELLVEIEERRAGK